MASLLELAKQIHDEERDGLPADPQERAAELTRALSLERPETTTRARQRAAAQAVGVDAPPTSSEAADILTETSPRGRARAATKRARGVTKRARGRGRAILKAPGRAISGATSVRGVIAQMFALVVLYWLLRTASRTQGAEFLEGVVSGLRRPFEWLFATGGVPGRGGVGVGVSSEGVGGITTAPVGAPGGIPSQAFQTAEVEQWRPLVAKHFPPGMVDKALRVIYCESRGNPDARNPSSDASGLFQHLPQFWPSRSQAAGFGGASIFNPEANVATAAFLATRDGWRHWPNCGKL